MIEAEAKVKLTPALWKRLKEEIPQNAGKGTDVFYKDIYFSEEKKFYMRIRKKKNGTDILTIKNKKWERGLEANREIEWNIKSSGNFIRFLKKIGIIKTAEKIKKGQVFKKGDLRIELNHVKNLGYFLEIETFAVSRKQLERALKALKLRFSELGFTEKDFERKNYLDLLKEI